MSDLICRDDLLCEIRKKQFDTRYDFSLAIDTIKNAPAVDAVRPVHGKWISVKDMLPEPEKHYYLVKTTWGAYHVAYFDYDENKWFSNYGVALHATHWMPLPEPPEEDAQ